MYRIIPASKFITAAWKNGGGITHEIARDAPDWGWRCSIADVASDGPFSRFDAMARILTVISGAGLQLRHAGGVLTAQPLIPLHFSGDTALQCRRISGNVRDFNVIYAPDRFCMDVQILAAGDYPDGAGLTGLLLLSGQAAAGGALVPPGGFALGRGAVAVQGQAIRVTILRR